MAKKTSKANVATEKPAQFLFGFVDVNGKMTIPASFDAVTDFFGGYASFKKNAKWGITDKSGNHVVEPTFDLLGNVRFGFAPFRTGNLWGLVDIKGKTVVPAEYEKIYAVTKTTFVAHKAGDIHLLNTSGVTLAHGFKEILQWNNGLAVAATADGWGVVDEKGQWLVKPQYDAIYDFSEGFAAFELNGQSGYLNLKGEVAIKPQFQSAYDFSEGLARVQKEDKFGYINTKGEIVIPCTWDDANDGNQGDISKFSEGRAVVAVRESYSSNFGYIDNKGQILHECTLYSAQPFKEGFALAVSTTENVFLDRSCKPALQPELYIHQSFSEGLACGNTPGNNSFPQIMGYVDKQGKTVIKPLFTEAVNFKNGIACGPTTDRGFVVIDKTGKVLLQNLDAPVEFHEGLAKVRTTNEAWEVSEDQVKLTKTFEDQLEKYDKFLKEAMEKDTPALIAAQKKILARKFDGAAYLDLMIYDMNDYSVIAYPIFTKKDAKGKVSEDFESNSFANATPEVLLKNLEKVSETKMPSEPNTQKGVERLRGFLNEKGLDVLTWFADCWHQAGGKNFKLPAYVRLEDGEVYVDLKTKAKFSQDQVLANVG